MNALERPGHHMSMEITCTHCTNKSWLVLCFIDEGEPWDFSMMRERLKQFQHGCGPFTLTVTIKEQ